MPGVFHLDRVDQHLRLQAGRRHGHVQRDGVELLIVLERTLEPTAGLVHLVQGAMQFSEQLGLLGDIGVAQLSFHHGRGLVEATGRAHELGELGVDVDLEAAVPVQPAEPLALAAVFASLIVLAELDQDIHQVGMGERLIKGVPLFLRERGRLTHQAQRLGQRMLGLLAVCHQPLRPDEKGVPQIVQGDEAGLLVVQALRDYQGLAAEVDGTLDIAHGPVHERRTAQRPELGDRATASPRRAERAEHVQKCRLVERRVGEGQGKGGVQVRLGQQVTGLGEVIQRQQPLLDAGRVIAQAQPVQGEQFTRSSLLQRGRVRVGQGVLGLLGTETMVAVLARSPAGREQRVDHRHEVITDHQI